MKNELIPKPKNVDNIKNSNKKNDKNLQVSFNLDKNEDSNLFNGTFTREDKLEMLNKIFLINSIFDTKVKEYFLTRFQIILILKESDILNDNIITKTEADLLLTKINRKSNKFKFMDFLNYLTEICKHIFKDGYNKNPKLYMNNFLEYLLVNYFDYLEDKLSSNFVENNIENSCTINSLNAIIESEIERHALKLLLSLNSSLKKLYICYFPFENNTKFSNEPLMLKSMDNFITFGRDFEILPYMISEKNFTTYYNLLIKHQKKYIETINDTFQSITIDNNNSKFVDCGQIFKFSSFILFLYHFSLLLYYKKFKVQFEVDNLSKPEDIEIILFFLQKLERSKGIGKYVLKRERTNDDKFTFIPTKKDIENALMELGQNYYGGKTVLTTMNDYNITNTLFLDDKKELGKADYINTYNRFGTFTSYDNNQTWNKEEYPLTQQDNNKNMFKGEEICKDNKNRLELINKFLIKTLNSTPSNLKKSFCFKNDTQTIEVSFKNKTNPLLDLENFMNVNSEIVQLISERLDNLEELFLKYSRINDKLAFNRMSFSSFLKFLKNSDILIGIPENLKDKYKLVGERLTQKNINVSEIKIYSLKLKGSVPCKSVVLSNTEKDYKSKIDRIVNASSKSSTGKLSIGEASVIFYSLTNSKNFPLYTQSTKLQFDRNKGMNLNVGDNWSKTSIFDKKLFLENQHNVPGKMDFILFIKSFELIAAKLYPNNTLNQAVLKLLKTKIFPMLTESDIINSKDIIDSMNKLEDQDVQFFLKEFCLVIYPIYIQYTDTEGEMHFNQFLSFYTQFGLFPEMITLTRMKIIFSALNEFAKENNNKILNTELNNSKIEEMKFNFDMFINALGITALLFNYKNIVNDIDRLLLMCYKMQNSKIIKNDKLDGMVSSQANKNFNEFLKKVHEKFGNKKIKKNISNKDSLEHTYKKSLEQLSLQFDLDEDDKSKENILNTFC